MHSGQWPHTLSKQRQNPARNNINLTIMVQIGTYFCAETQWQQIRSNHLVKKSNEQQNTQQIIRTLGIMTSHIEQRQKRVRSNTNHTTNPTPEMNLVPLQCRQSLSCHVVQSIKNPRFLFLKQIDQSDCSVSLGKWCHRDDRDTTWPITKYFCKHTVLNITTYKKIRVKWIFVYFMKMHGNFYVYKTKHTLECVTFL